MVIKVKHAEAKINRMLDIQNAISSDTLYGRSYKEMYIELESIRNEIISELSKNRREE